MIELSGLNLANRWKHFRRLLERETRSTRQHVRESSWPYASDVADELKKEGGIPFGLFSLADNKDPSSLFFLGTGCAEPSAWRGASAILIRNGRLGERAGELQLYAFTGPTDSLAVRVHVSRTVLEYDNHVPSFLLPFRYDDTCYCFCHSVAFQECQFFRRHRHGFKVRWNWSLDPSAMQFTKLGQFEFGELLPRRIQSPLFDKQSMLQDRCFNMPESLAKLGSSSGKDLKNVVAVFIPTACFDSLVVHPSRTFRIVIGFYVGWLSVFLLPRSRRIRKGQIAALLWSVPKVLYFNDGSSSMYYVCKFR